MPKVEEVPLHPRDLGVTEPMHDVGTAKLPRTQGEEVVDASGPQPPPPASISKGVLLAAVVVLLLAALLIFRGIHSRHQAEAQLTTHTQAESIPIVRVTHPSGGGEPGEVVLPANVEAFIDTPIYARTSGYLRHWYFDIGAHVKQGQLLAIIETPELDQQVLQGQADLRTAQSNLQLAQVTATRWESLLKKNAVSHQEADQATSGLASSQSNVAAMQANVSRLQQMQSFERVYAPFDGVITARNIDVGALIQAGDNTAPKELFHLAAMRKLRVFVPVPEVYESAVKNGEHVVLTSDAFPNEKFQGTLVRNSQAVDPASRTLNVEVDIDNTTGKLLPGAYAFVHLNVPQEAHATTIPSNTLLFRAEGLRVGVVENGRAQLRPITIGHDYGATVEILSGLAGSDQVILDPSDSLESGDPVQVESQAAVASQRGAAQ
jgi:RND family efflux transporter MFP subunit